METASPDTRPLILVVDDQPSNLHVLAAALKASYRIKTATDGATALALAGRSDQPDLILLDVMMPGMSGHQVLAALRDTPKTRHIPVIFVTADASVEGESQGFALGADDYVVKPVAFPILMARIENLLAQRRATQALRQNEERLEMVVQGANLGLWDWDIVSGHVTFNQRWAEMLGYRIDEIPPNVDSWKHLVHPEDFARIGAALEPHLRGETARYACEHRLLHKENRWIWVHDAGQVTVRDANGKALRAAGIHLDITASKQAEATLRAQQEHLSALLAAMDDWVFVIDTSGRFADIHWPPAQPGCAWPDAADWAGRDYASLLPADLSEVISTAIVGLMADGVPRRQEFTWQLEGQQRHFLATFSALMKGTPWPQGFLCVARDISELKHLEQRLREQAMTDALTGVTNRRSFYEAINSELARVLRFDSSASLLMLDLDHFKQVNDRFGHAGGDEVLRHFCHLAQQRLRSSDLLGRLGGEEFAILLPGTDLTGATRFAEELCRLVAATPGRCGKQIIPFTVSIGVTSLRPGDENSDASFARADQALYRAKEQGRNRVEVAAQ